MSGSRGRHRAGVITPPAGAASLQRAGTMIDVGGGRISVREVVPADPAAAGEPVLLLHGFPTSSRLWDDVADQLAGPRRVVLPDLLGYGDSDPPGGQPLSLRAHAERVLAVMDALGINYATVAGHELGGGVAVELAMRWPHRVRRLCLVSAVAFDEWPTREVRLARAMLPLTRHLPATWLLTLLRTDLLRGYADEARGTRSVDDYALPFATPAGRDAFMEHLVALDPGETAAVADRLGQLVQPTAVVWGAHDPFLPAAVGRRLHRAIPGSTLTMLADGRHFIPEECAAELCEVISALLER